MDQDFKSPNNDTVSLINRVNSIDNLIKHSQLPNTPNQESFIASNNLNKISNTSNENKLDESNKNNEKYNQSNINKTISPPLSPNIKAKSSSIKSGSKLSPEDIYEENINQNMINYNYYSSIMTNTKSSGEIPSFQNFLMNQTSNFVS